MINNIDICGDDVITMNIPEVECDACEEFENRLTDVENGLVETTSTAQTALNLAEELEDRTGYANIEVGGQTLHADSHDATLGLVAGQNIVLTPNQIDGTVTITASETGETLENVKDATGVRSVVGNDVMNNTATGDYSSAFGTNTTASGDGQFVVGRYNVDDTNDEFAFIVGNGSSESNMNAFAVDWNGVPYFRGLPGTSATENDTASATSGTDVYLDNIYTSDHWGIFIGFARVQFAANSSGRRVVTVTINHTNQTTVETHSRWIGAPSPTQQTIVTLPIVENIHAGEGIGVKVYQNSGTDLSVTAYVHGFILRAT